MALQIDALPTPPSTSSPSTFDALADAFIAALPDFVTQTNAVAEEVEDSVAGFAAADVSLSTRVSTEEVTRAAADTSLTTRVSTEESARATADTSLTTRVSTEETSRSSGDTSLTTRVSTEELARSTADTSLATLVNNLIASADAMVFKGLLDCSANPNYPAADAGWTYRVSVAGKIGGGSGTDVEVGDTLICAVDASSAGTQAAVGANWGIVQTNINWSTAETSLNSRISTEVVDRAAADTSLTTRVSTEEVTRASADTSVTSRVSTEEAARAAADTSLTTRLSTEEAARASADTSLSTRVSTEEVTRGSADTSLTTRLSTEEAARATADTSIVTRFSTADGSLTTRVSTEEATRATADTSLTTRVSTVELSAPLSNNVATSAPTVNDDSGDGYSVGSRWIWAAEGALWICLDATVGAAVWMPIDAQTKPPYVAGNYYAPGTVTRANSNALNDNVVAIPLEIRERVTIDQLVIRVNAGVGGSTALLGIYSDSSGVPGALIAQGTGSTSTATSSTTASVSFSPNPVLAPGRYWLACLTSSNPSLLSISNVNSLFSDTIGSATLAHILPTSASASISGVYAAQPYASGLPSSFPTPTVAGGIATTFIAWRAA